ncbi:MAG TPA: acetyl-CoA acetyltransferase [Acidimicrobiia bacterium]|nr:acetyl-CoA acetyltransferase [Acidimicrobiia bacterium]
MAAVDPRAPCLIGVGQRTWHPAEVGDEGAPEPLVMWEDVVRRAADDTGVGSAALDRLDSLQIVYCQTWQYDDPPARLADALGISPRHAYYSGIGGTTPQVLVNGAAERILAGELDVALVCGAEALATQRRYKRRGERYPYRFKPEERRPFPWEAPFHPAEVAHEVFQAWLTFAIFDNARRGHLGVGLDEYRGQLGDLLAPFTDIAAANPNAWFPVARSAGEIITATSENRMVGYPYTKYMVSIMDVDMAAAVLLASHEAADALGVPPDRRVYLRGWCYATDPTYVAEHDDMWRSPAMAAAAGEAMRVGGVDVDDVAHLDVYSCFGSSVNFARDALGLGEGDSRPLTVTGGLPYHGGAGSDYMTHSIATMAGVLRRDPGSYGLVSGVGMHMTKHVYGLYSTEPGPVATPEQKAVQAKLDADGRRVIRDVYDGAATVAAYSVVHGKDGEPEWGVVVCDVPEGDRAYGKVLDAAMLESIERDELVGRKVTLTPTEAETPAGKQTMNVATL